VAGTTAIDNNAIAIKGIAPQIEVSVLHHA
jgi:hypothetical protein